MYHLYLGAAAKRKQFAEGAPPSRPRFFLTASVAALFTISSASSAFATLDNTAEATGTPAAGTLVNPSDTLQVPVQAKDPKYTVVKSVVSVTTSNGGVNTLTDGGDVITYQYVVVNTGNVSLSTVSLTDAGPTFDGNAATNTLSALSGPVGDAGAPGVLDVGETWTYSATYTLDQADVDNAAGVLNGVANAVVASANDPQATPAVQDVGTDLTATTTIPASPTLTIDKRLLTGTPTPLALGQTITYEYVVVNTGNVTITGVSVNETAFNGSGTAPVPAPGATTLAPGAQTIWTATYTVTQADIDNLQ